MYSIVPQNGLELRILPEYLPRIHKPLRVKYGFYPFHELCFTFLNFHAEIRRLCQAYAVLSGQGPSELKGDLEYFRHNLNATGIFFLIILVNHNIDMQISISCMTETYYFYPAAFGYAAQLHKHNRDFISGHNNVLVDFRRLDMVQRRGDRSPCLTESFRCH